MRKYKRLLSIAGSDSGGGAGIQVDLKTFSALGCYGMTVVTAITSQNTKGVTGVWPMATDCVEQQLEAVLSDIGVDAVKIGMLWSLELAERVADILVRYKAENVVFDPVMVAQSGDVLMKQDVAADLARILIPVSTVVTPNIPEATWLLGYDINDREDMKKAAEELLSWGFKNVLLKGGHLDENAAFDIIVSKNNKTDAFHSARVETENNHGTGCTLSSAIASYLAHGYDITEACRMAKNYVTDALIKGADYKIGEGHGPVHHFYRIWT